MLVLRGEILYTAPKDSSWGHEEWFQARDWPDAMDRVRGFYDKRGVFLYQRTRGSNWDVTSEVIQAAPIVARKLRIMKNLVPDHYDDLELGLPVYGGMVPGVLGTLWGPKRNLGIKVGDIKEPSRGK